jgi:hypothetical protein
MEKNNKCCIGILKWQLFWEKEKMLKRLLLWDGGSKILQRKWGIGTKTKAIERESKNIMWVWERKLSQKLSKNGCSNDLLTNVYN